MTATVVTSENAAEFYASKSGPVIEDTVVADKAEPVVDEVTEEDNEAESEAKQQDEHKPGNPKIDKRIQVIAKQRNMAQEELVAERNAKAALEAKVQEMEARLNPPAKVDASEAKPQPSQFTDAFEYAEALAEWAGENALRNRDKQQAEEKAAKERDNVVKAWTDRQKAVEVELPDYADTIASSDVQVSDQVRDAILESDAGPKILYHLAKNPEVAEALASKTARQALVEIGRLEAKLSGDKAPASVKPVETPSRAPAPITPIKATKGVESPIGSDGEFHGTFAAWKEARRTGKIK
jgi:hypothetical protein